MNKNNQSAKPTLLSRISLGVAAACLVGGVAVGGGTLLEVHHGDTTAASTNQSAVDAFKASPAVSSPVSGSGDGKGTSSHTAHQEAVEGDTVALLSGTGLTGELAVKTGSSVEALQSIADSGLVAHYESSSPVGSVAKDGKKGDGVQNIILTAHRNTHGAAFHNVPSLKMGDTMTLTTKNGEYEFKVVRAATKLSSPEDTSFNRVPSELPQNGTYLTLLTCGSWLSDERWIVVLKKSD